MRRLQGFLCRALGDHLATGRAPLVPLAGVPIWQAFAALSIGRGFHAAGPLPIGLGAIEAQGRLMGLPFARRHVEVLRAMDQVWLGAFGQGKPKAAAVPLTAELFDAMMG